MRWRVFVTHTPDEARDLIPDEARERLEQAATVLYNRAPRHLSAMELREACAAADAVVTEAASGGDDGFFAACPSLKVFARCAATVQNVDVAAATRRGVLVLASPPQYVRPMVELMVGLMVVLSYRVVEQHTSLRASGAVTRARQVGTELAGETLGIVGLGRIGRELARAAERLDMRVVAYDPHVLPSETAVPLVALESLLRASRFVAICARLTPETRNLIDAAAIAAMRRDAFLLQTAQGGIVDERALAAALREGRLAGAAVDVFTDEPDIRSNPLLTAPRTILTPHIAGHSVNGYRAAAHAAIDALIEIIEGRIPATVVNRDVLAGITGTARWNGWPP